MDCHDINVAIAPAKNDDRPVPPNAPIDQNLMLFVYHPLQRNH